MAATPLLSTHVRQKGTRAMAMTDRAWGGLDAKAVGQTMASIRFALHVDSSTRSYEASSMTRGPDVVERIEAGAFPGDLLAGALA
jgi:hypothetical protein